MAIFVVSTILLKIPNNYRFSNDLLKKRQFTALTIDTTKT